MKILIIEDEILLADSLRAMLEGKGFSVEAVHDGETGAEYAETGVYDLLILDVMMPGMDGYQVARQVRAKRARIIISRSPLTRGSCWPASVHCSGGRARRSTRSRSATRRSTWPPER